MATSFAAGLGDYLAGLPKLNKWQDRVQIILDAKPSARRTWFVKILESHARAQLGVGAGAAVDWGSVDWAALLTAILKFLLMILPLFLGAPPTATTPKSKKALGRTRTRKRL